MPDMNIVKGIWIALKSVGNIAKVVKAAASYSSHARLGPHTTQSGQMLDLPQTKL